MCKYIVFYFLVVLFVYQCAGDQKNITKKSSSYFDLMIKDKNESKKAIIINPKTFKPYKAKNPKKERPKILPKSMSRNETIGTHWANWGSWSRCMKCMQRRMMTCVNPSWCDSRIYEEKMCDKRRCRRKIKERIDFNIVHLNKSSTFLLKQAPSDIWSRWHEWTPCSKQCKTSRSRMCRKPGRCSKQIQTQSAYCYFQDSNCEQYVLHLIDRNKMYYDNRRYEYQNDTAPIRPRRRKRCGRPTKKSSMLKIIGGREAKKHKWPWHVAVINRYDEVFCGGTLIAPRWVLTASHCIRSYLRVRLNEHDLSALDGSELEFRVSKMFPHPKFNSRTVDNDIALLQLPMAVKSPVACLPNKPAKPGELCSVMGWGKLNSNHKYGTAILNEAKLPIIPSKACRNAYKQFLITNNMLCAGWTSGKQDTCAGDSGGGLMCPVNARRRAYKVNGITSFGDGCGIKHKYGIYTTVYNYIRWINYIMDHYS